MLIYWTLRSYLLIEMNFVYSLIILILYQFKIHLIVILCSVLFFRNKKRFHHQALIEVRILDHLRKKDPDGSHNVIHMLEYFYFRNHLCISFELMKYVFFNCNCIML